MTADSGIADVVDRGACVQAFGDWEYPIIKHRSDLWRYDRVIRRTEPEVLVECGSRGGHSARWFADRGCDVISVDIDPPSKDRRRTDAVTYVGGNSVDPKTFQLVQAMVRGRRCMVSLDSDHSESHVRAEIELYRELVTLDCALVVEDGIIDWLPTPKPHGCDIYTGSVLAAIEATLPGDGRFERALDIETMSPVTMFPAGWWRRVS